MRVEVKRNVCLGAMACVIVDADHFKMDEENKAVLKKADGTWTRESVVYENLTEDQAKKIIEAAESCPLQAIFVWDDEGKQVFPRTR